MEILKSADALAVAAELSTANTSDRVPMAVALEQLSVSEMRALLTRVAEGRGPGVMGELKRLTFPQVQTFDSQAMLRRIEKL